MSQSCMALMRLDRCLEGLEVIRRYTEHTAKSIDHERLMVITVYEHGVTKEQIKQDNIYSKKHGKVVV